MTSTRCFLSVLLLVAVAATGVLDAQTMGRRPPKSEMEQLKEQDPELARAIEVAKPGKEHNPLRRIVGVWDARAKVWQGKGTKALNGRGRAVNRMILGGRFLQSTFRGTVDGDSLVGFSIDGYDKGLEKYVSVWVDNQSTTILNYEGTASEDGTSINWTATVIHPMNRKPVHIRGRTSIVDANTYRYEQWTRFEGAEEFRNMDIGFTREGSDD